MKTRAVDAEGTIIIDNGLYIYGTYTRVKDGVYQLSNQTTIRIKDNGITGYATITYTNSFGVDITIVVDRPSYTPALPLMENGQLGDMALRQRRLLRLRQAMAESRQSVPGGNLIA